MVTLISLEQAIDLLTQGLSPLGHETCPLEQALGRTLAADVTAPVDQPPFDRSPLDGYAVRAADIAAASPETPARLRVIDTVYAGDVAKVAVGAGEAVLVTTGAMLPAGCDCVVRQEHTDRGDPLAVYTPVKAYQNYVYRGEDYRQGALLLAAGTRLDAAAVGVLASAGLTHVTVRRRPLVGLLTTGDEVVAPGAPLPPGKIYGSNGPMLAARLAEAGFAVRVRHQGDCPEAVADVLRTLLAACDLVISTGGVSVGDKDIFHQALPLLGAEQIFWRVELKPGTPALYARYQGKPILSLSGNPFAAFTTFELLARPLLAALSGEPDLLLRQVEGVLDDAFDKASPARRFLRGRYAQGRVTLPAGHASGVLASLVGCNCLVELPAGSPPMCAGQTVRVWLL